MVDESNLLYTYIKPHTFINKIKDACQGSHQLRFHFFFYLSGHRQKKTQTREIQEQSEIRNKKKRTRKGQEENQISRDSPVDILSDQQRTLVASRLR